jgi:hypothetical protein
MNYKTIAQEEFCKMLKHEYKDADGKDYTLNFGEVWHSITVQLKGGSPMKLTDKDWYVLIEKARKNEQDEY